jgi:hypothetical protein
MSKPTISFLGAEAAKPVFIERSGTGWVSYGEENRYPLYLLELLNESSKHGAIVTGKASYIAGRDLRGTSRLLKRANRHGESLHRVVKKLAMDVETFGGYYAEVIKGAGGQVEEIFHVPYQKVRMNKARTTCWVSNNWTASAREEKPRAVPVVDDTLAKGMLVYREYRPGLDTYSLPGYFAALNWIAADAEVSKHVLQNAMAGFMGSKLVNMNDGEPTDDEKKEIEKQFNDKFTGHNGKKLVISYNATPEVAPTILDLGASDLTKEDYSAIDQLIEQNVFSGHRITSPMLFGIKTAGQLGGRTEMRDAWELFKNAYIQLKQDAIMEHLQPWVGPFEIVELEPVGFESSDTVLAAALAAAPKRWLLDKLGVKKEEYPEAFAPPPAPPMQPVGHGAPPAAPGTVPVAMAAQDYTAFQKFGQPRGEFTVVKARQVKFSTDLDAANDELDLVTSDFFQAQKFAVTTLEGRILELLKEDSTMTPADLATALDVRKTLVDDTMKRLEKQGVIKPRMVKDQDKNPIVSWDIVEGVATPQARPSSVEIGVRYSYEVKPEYREPNDEDPTGQIIPTSRDFCRALIQADRFYTRRDIEAMSAEMGYSVWDQKGGFMGVRGGQGEALPACRHTWVSNVVVKRVEK